MSGKRTLGHRIRPWAQFSFSSRVRLERCDSVFLFDVWYLFHTTVPKQIHHPLSSLRAYILTKIARTFPSDTIQSRTVCSPFLVLCVRPIPQMSNWWTVESLCQTHCSRVPLSDPCLAVWRPVLLVLRAWLTWVLSAARASAHAGCQTSIKLNQLFVGGACRGITSKRPVLFGQSYISFTLCEHKNLNPPSNKILCT